MDGPTRRDVWRPSWFAARGLAWIGGSLAGIAAAAVATVLTLVFAVSFFVIGLMAVALLTLMGLSARARRRIRRDDPNVIEARNIGGHSWVAYGWDGRR
jgi:hypothetical protein